MVRRHYRFYGSVQGVGFRYRARYAASLFGVSGWVRNCWDGSVEMEAQGDEANLAHMLERIFAGAFIQVERMERDDLPVDETERDFRTLD
ncbi:MAG: acylphosphatase [Clostridia bacterium]|nr:acylphosphatase [Clostridia bacterium]